MSFTQVLNLSISASWLVLAIVMARGILKNAPKALHCALWALVAIRLLCPVSFESEMSLIPSREVIPEHYLSMEPVEQSTPARLEIVTNPVYEESVTIDTETTVDLVQNWDLYATLLWLAGVGAMGIYAAYSYLSIRIRVRMAGWSHGRVWECDDIDSPFILGLLWPRIYLPSGLDEITKAHVLAHENAHLKRLDHIWKPLGFALLTIHWFNPVMWAAYVLLCRDIELACDEKVIKRLEKPQVRAYSEALVRCSVSQRRIAMCPLAFGEVGVKGRIKSMLNYRKPGFWVMVIAIAVSIAVAVCFLTDPVQKPDTLQHIREEDGCTIVSQTPETLHVEIYKDFLPENILNGKLHTFEEDEFIFYRSDTTTIYLESARLYGNELMLTLNFRYELPESGDVLLPYQFEDGGRVWTAAPPDDSIARIIQYGPDPSIAVGIGMEVLEEAGEYISFDLCDMNRLTYRSDYLVDAPTTRPAGLEAIVKEDGYLITSNEEETLHLMFYTHWLPEGFERGYSFAEDELVLMETETTKLQMQYAILDGEQYCFDFQFSYDLPETGTIYVPYLANIKGINSSLRLNGEQIHDYTKDITEGVTLTQVRGTEAFSLLVDRDVYDSLRDYLSVTLDGVYALTYVRSGIGLEREQYFDIRERYEVGEFERFLISDDLHLIGCEPEILFPIERDLGLLQLTEPDGLPISDKLRRNNQYVWRCEAFGRINLLLMQEDGTLYVLTLTDDETDVAEQYKLDLSNESRHPMDAKVIGRRFTLDVTGTFDLPMFTLNSDGTFTLHISNLSSYIGFGSYTLTEEKLILKTKDGLYAWYFDVTADGFAYDFDQSSPIRYYETPKELTELHDGVIFRSPEYGDYAPPALESGVDELIRAAIRDHNFSGSQVSIFVQSHKVLAELAVCGAAAVDGEPTEELIVYLYALCQEYSTNGDIRNSEGYRLFPAELTFTMTDSGYQLVQYTELTDEEAEDRFPAFAYEDLKQNRDSYDVDLVHVCYEKVEEQLIYLRKQMVQAELLFDIVATSPAQYSNPGAYIDDHPDEWAQLLELGAATVQYSFQKLATGEEYGLEGYLMALASRDIIESWGEDCKVDSYFNGQNWFAQFASQAEQTADTMSWDELRRTHPGCTLAIIHTAYQQNPPA